MTPDVQRVRAAHIRRAVSADAGPMFDMLIELADHQGQRDSVAVTADRLHVLLHRDDVVVFIAERDHRLLGYVSAVRQLNLWAGTDILVLDDLYVRLEARGGGVGRELMLAIATEAGRTGTIVRWEAETDNLSAHRFYNRLRANLRTKTIAAWLPEEYQRALAEAVTVRS